MNTTKIKKCGVRSCRTCPYLEESNSFFSNSTGERYFPMMGGESFLNCKSENIIYLISCRICNFQYVGETKNRLQTRFSGHKNNIKSGTSCQLVHKHFQEDGHGLSNCKIIPIEKIILNDHQRQNFNQMQQLIALNKIRLDREKIWISKLQTAYPFGLNSRVKGIGDFNPSQGDFLLFGGRRRRRKKKHGRRKPKRLRSRNIFDMAFVKTKHQELNGKAQYFHFFKTFLYGLPRVDLQKLHQEAENSSNQIEERLKDLIIMICNIRLFRPVQISEKNNKEYYHIKFRDKGLDYINIASILRSSNIKNKIPLYFTEKDPPIIGYSFNQSIAGILFNYKQTLSEEVIDRFEQNNIVCNCVESVFKDSHHGHIITGNLDIVENETLRGILKKGPKYRLPQKINWTEDRKIIENFLDSYIDKWVAKERKLTRDQNLNKGSLKVWRNSILEIVDKKISRGKLIFKKNWSLKIEGNIKRELERLKDRYVITVTDKAQNNILFTCKLFYISQVKEELSKPGQITYQPENKDLISIDRDILNFSNSKNINVSDRMKGIPLIYWIPKMHKNPIGSRFIAGSRFCSIKPLSKYFSKALKTILKHMKLYSATVSQRAGLNYFWIVDNSLEFLEKIRGKNVVHMETFDFSTLYTALPHPEIKKNFLKIFQKVYKRENKQFINVNSQGAYFSSVKRKNYSSFQISDLMEILEFLLNNIYVKYGNKIYKQVIGIPIGLDSGQDIANLLLFSYESEYVENISKQNLVLARKFNLCARYIDDLFVGNFPNFKEHLYRIYPRALEIKPESNNTKDIAYLDLRIKYEEGALDISIFDKRENFSFAIVNFPYMDSCIPKKSALGVYYSQLLRYARICSKFTSFNLKGRALIDKLKSQGYRKNDLKRLSSKFFQNQNDILEKYRISDSQEFLNKLFQ